MRIIPIIFILVTHVSCAQMMPGLFKTVDDIETVTAIDISVSKDALQKETDLSVEIKVLNKDQK